MNDAFDHIADELAHVGVAVSDGFLAPQEIHDLLTLDEFQNGLLHFKKAGMGSKGEWKINESIRGDYVKWIDRSLAAPGLTVYLNRLEQLMHALNRSLFLSLKDFEIHMTQYPPGARYERHIDQFKHNDHRRLSVILYLNIDWIPEYGGQLRLHLHEGIRDVLPVAGRLVCFRSDQVEHEVLPATQPRLSITGWMLDQLVELKHL